MRGLLRRAWVAKEEISPRVHLKGGGDAVVEEGFPDVVREEFFVVGGALEEVAFVEGEPAGGGEERGEVGRREGKTVAMGVDMSEATGKARNKHSIGCHHWTRHT